MSMSAARKHVARNVLGDAWKEKYYGLQVISSTVDGSSIAASSNLLAMSWESGGGGTVAILSPDQLNERKPSLSYYRGHTGAVQDIQFCPFYSTIFATASEDTTIKLWDCGNICQEIEPRQDAVATLKGHSKRVCFTVFNEVAEWVLASGATDGCVKVWDMEMQRDVYSQDYDSPPVSLRWNASCSILALTNRNRELSLLDPRTNTIVGAPILAHEGAKPAKLDWCYNSNSVSSNYLVTSGFSKSAERQIRLWDTRNLEQCVAHKDLDRASAILQPYVDPGTGLLLLYGKGNRSIYFYGIESDDFIKFGEFEQLEPWKDVAIAPKRCVNVKKCEILRCYGSLSAGIVQPISIVVPRRNMSSFQDDLYPDCLSGDPALRALEWFQGQNAEPVRASMRPVEGKSLFEEKRPANSGHLSFSRELAPVRGTSSVLKKCLSVNKQTSEALLERLRQLEEELSRKNKAVADQQSSEVLLARIRQLEEELAQKNKAVTDQQSSEALLARLGQLEEELARKNELLRIKSAEMEELRRSSNTSPTAVTPDGRGVERSINLSTMSAETNNMRASPYNTDDLDCRLADLAKRTSLNEENLAELRKLICKTTQKKDCSLEVESPSEIIKMLLDRIASLQRRYDRVHQRNEVLESLYSSLRKI